MTKRLDDIDTAIRLHNEGFNNKEIAKVLGVQPSTIRYNLAKAGIKSYPRSYWKLKYKPSADFNARLYELYVKKQLSTREIAPILGLTSKTDVLNYLKRAGIARRDNTEATLLSMEKKLGRPVKRLGDRFTNQYGYVLVKNPRHHRANSLGYVFEHILVWEENHVSLVPPTWQIHHLNGIRNDNRPENLVAMPGRKHQLLIKALQEKIKSLQNELQKERANVQH